MTTTIQLEELVPSVLLREMKRAVGWKAGGAGRDTIGTYSADGVPVLTFRPTSVSFHREDEPTVTVRYNEVRLVPPNAKGSDSFLAVHTPESVVRIALAAKSDWQPLFQSFYLIGSWSGFW